MNYKKISYSHLSERIWQILMPWLFLTFDASHMVFEMLLVCFKKALEDTFKSQWVSNSKYTFVCSNQFVNNQDLRTITSALLSDPLAVSLLQAHISSTGEVVNVQFIATILDLFSLWKVSEMLFQLMQSSINTSGVTET